MNFKKIHITFGLLVLVLAVYIGLKTLPENGWSGWSNGSAQTLLSTEYWAKDGIVQNKALFIPMGYTRLASYFDEPELRHHARGTVTGGLIGRRLYYTHYPSGYLLPFALIRKAGFEQKHWFRLYSLSVSLVALILMYVFINMISTPAVALASAAYYGISLMFIDYADSLANQPLDDMLRFAILPLSILAIRSAGKNTALHGYNLLIWALYFLLANSSYDSTFFIYLWLVGIELLMLERKGSIIETLKGIPIRKWALFASAPVLAFCIQILQNYWYLGFNEMILDFKGVFADRSTDAEAAGGFIYSHIHSMLAPLFLLTDIELKVSVVIMLAMAIMLVISKKKFAPELPDIRIIVALFVAGMAFTFVFAAAQFDYQGRQYAPAISLLVGSATVFTLGSLLGKGLKKRLIYGVIMLPLLGYIWYAQVSKTVKYIPDWPNHQARQDMIVFFKKIKALTENEAVVFMTHPGYEERYLQPEPVFEYYSGRLLLNFQNIDDTIRDYLWLANRSRDPFDAIMVVPSMQLVQELESKLQGNAERHIIENKYVLLIKSQ